MGSKSISPLKKRKAINFVKDGGTRREAAKLIGVSRRTIYNWIKAGIEDGSLNKDDFKIPVTDSDSRNTFLEYVKKFSSEKTIAEISEDLGRSESSLRSLAWRLGMIQKNNHLYLRAEK